jgi:hypothetical protein
MAKRKTSPKKAPPLPKCNEKMSQDQILFFEGLRNLRRIEDPDLKHLAGKALENIWLSLPVEDDIVPSDDK